MYETQSAFSEQAALQYNSHLKLNVQPSATLCEQSHDRRDDTVTLEVDDDRRNNFCALSKRRHQTGVWESSKQLENSFQVRLVLTERRQEPEQQSSPNFVGETKDSQGVCEGSLLCWAHE